MSVTWTIDARRPTLAARVYRWAMHRARDDRAFSGAARTLRTALQRQREGDRPPTWWTRRAVLVDETAVGGGRCWRLRPRRGHPQVRVLYLHGGGYVHPLTVDYWRLVRCLVRAGAEVVVPAYPLAPSHTVQTVLPWLEGVHEAVDDGHLPGVLMGDSAGGALVVGLARRLRGTSHQADLVVALCPWWDATLRQPEVARLEPSDPLLTESGLRAAGRWWSGALPAADPVVSPALAAPQDLAGLPPVDVWIGDHDILRPAVDVVVATLERAGGQVRVHEVPAMFHVWMTRLLPEARRTRRELARRLREVAAAHRLATRSVAGADGDPRTAW